MGYLSQIAGYRYGGKQFQRPRPEIRASLAEKLLLVRTDRRKRPPNFLRASGNSNRARLACAKTRGLPTGGGEHVFNVAARTTP